jgi:hypothetical protein
MNQEVMNIFNQSAGPVLRPDPDFDGQPGENPLLVLRRDEEA